jgi:outer membrane protein assembly factor BamB
MLGWAGVTFDGGMLYTGSTSGEVVALNSSSPRIEWSYPITMKSQGLSCGSSSQEVPLYGTPAVGGDLVYVGAYNGKVYALNMATGAVRWVYPKEGYIGAIVGSPVVVNDTVYVSSSDGRVYALDVIYGEQQWKSEPLSEKLWTSPAVQEDTIYVSTYDDYIYALPTKGNLPSKDVEPTWTFQGEAGFASSPAVGDEAIFVGSFDCHIYAIDKASGYQQWKFPNEEPAPKWFWATPLVDDNIVYAASLDGKIYAINATNGEKLWEFDTKSPIVVSPILVDDLLVVASESGEIYVFKTDVMPEDKIMTPVKTIPIETQINAPIYAHENMVYIRAQDNHLYAVDIDQGKINWVIPITMME